MDFETLQRRLLASVKGRVQNGELTERGLARMIGISQPHMHHILKGARSLSVETADRILRRLGLSVLDLLEAEPHAQGSTLLKRSAPVGYSANSGGFPVDSFEEGWGIGSAKTDRTVV
jgi:transcriptional regulator with XRE-family HTH domain